MDTQDILENLFEILPSIELIDWDGIQLKVQTHDGRYDIHDLGGGDLKDLLQELEKRVDEMFGAFEVTIKTY